MTHLIYRSIFCLVPTSAHSFEDHTPLVVSTEVIDLMRSLSDPWGEAAQSPSGDEENKTPLRRNLGWIGGVFATVALAQFSTNLFLRVGECMF